MSFLDIELTNAAGSLEWFDFEEIGFKPLAIRGGGMPNLQNQITPFAGIDGAFFEGLRATSRRLIITGIAAGNVATAYALGGSLSNTYPKWHAARQRIIDAFKPSGGAGVTRRIRYRGAINASSQGEELIAHVRYDDGLQQSGDTNGFSERIVLVLVMVDPKFEEETEQTASLASRQTVSGRLFERSATGWTSIDNGGTAVVDAIYDKTGNVYWATANAVYCWDGTTSTDLSYPSGATISKLELDHLGMLYVAYWDGTNAKLDGYDISAETWASYSAATTTASNAVRALKFKFPSSVFMSIPRASGEDTVIEVYPSTNALVDVINLGSLEDALDFAVYNEKLLVGGTFTSFDTVPINRLAELAPSVEFADVQDSGSSDRVAHVIVSDNNTLYIFGTFDSVDGRTIHHGARYNGFTWVGVGLQDSGSFGFGVTNSGAVADGSEVWISTASDLTPDDGYPGGAGLWRYNGQSWRGGDVSTSSSAFIRDAFSGRLLLTDTADVTAAGVTTVSYTGSADSAPVLTLTNSTASTITISHVENVTTGKAAYFDLTIYPGEIMTIRFGRLADGQHRVTSSARGVMIGATYAGSQLETFTLEAGEVAPDGTIRSKDNVISLFASSASLTASLSWHNRHWSLDGGAVQ